MKYDLIRRCNARRRAGPPPCYGDDAARLIYDTKPLRLWRKKFIRGFLHTIKMRDLNISSIFLLPFFNIFSLSLSGIEFFEKYTAVGSEREIGVKRKINSVIHQKR
jgi:hypothetical protein